MAAGTHFARYGEFLGVLRTCSEATRIYVAESVYLYSDTLLMHNALSWQDTKLKVDAVSIPCHERAVRNCPWSVDLWLSHLKALERSHQSHDRVKGW